MKSQHHGGESLVTSKCATKMSVCVQHQLEVIATVCTMWNSTLTDNLKTKKEIDEGISRESGAEICEIHLEWPPYTNVSLLDWVL